MCESVSALKYENKYYFLTSDKLDTFLRSKKGIEWKKTHGTNDDDVKGHGFLEEFIYPELKGKAEHWECTDFSSPKNFPYEIVKQLKLGNLRFAIPDSPKQLLTEKVYDDYEAKRAPLYADYEAKRDALYADYEAKRDALDDDYEAKRAPLYADYKAKCAHLYADYKAKRAPLHADYKAKSFDLFWNIFMVKKNRTKAWK
jgi:hypothetical protein